MKKITYHLIINNKELNELYKKYIRRVRNLEKNLTNRTPSKIGLTCRWLRVSGKKGDNIITCYYGQHPDLEECIECFGLVYNNVKLSGLEDTLIRVRKYDEKVKPELKSLSRDTVKFNEDKLKKYMEKSLSNFIKKTDEFTS